MTDHLDDEALSACLDGEDAPGELAHLNDCPTCGTRLGELRRAAAVIGGPVAEPDPARREATIAAALGANVVSFASRRRPVWVGAVAAAAAVVLVAVVSVSQLRSTEPHHPTASDASATQERQALLTAPSGIGGVTRAELPERVRALGTNGPMAYDSGNDSAERNLGATTTSSADPCEATLRATDNRLGELLAVEALVLDGQPGRVFVFRRPPDLRGYVVADGGCEVLATVTVTP